jgi:hypothetical protein
MYKLNLFPLNIGYIFALYFILKNNIVVNTIFSGIQPRQLVSERNRRFGNHLCPHYQGSDVTGTPGVQPSHITTLIMEIEMVPETSVSSCNRLARLCAREDFIEFSRRKSFRLL